MGHMNAENTVAGAALYALERPDVPQRFGVAATARSGAGQVLSSTAGTAGALSGRKVTEACARLDSCSKPMEARATLKVHATDADEHLLQQLPFFGGPRIAGPAAEPSR